jgi:hypothetical protein
MIDPDLAAYPPAGLLAAAPPGLPPNTWLEDYDWDPAEHDWVPELSSRPVARLSSGTAAGPARASRSRLDSSTTTTGRPGKDLPRAAFWTGWSLGPCWPG